jgi:peptidoglycan hydrolase-like amidase
MGQSTRVRRAGWRRAIASALTLAIAAGSGAVAVPASAGAAGGTGRVAGVGSVALAAGPFGSTVVFDGHGFGHGIGLSQYGALGYALGGSTHASILDHYYGGTVAGTAGNDWMSVRLTALDGLNTSVVAGPSGTPIVTSADGAATPWKSLAALSTGANTYDVWGHLTTTVCAAGDLPGAGWQLIASVAGPVEFWSSADSSVAPRADLIGTCEGGGQVRSHRGSILAATDSTGARRTVNAQPVESYLRSVVGAEVPWSWGDQGGGAGMNALRAQAVAARSYALAQRRYTYQAPAGTVLAIAASTCDTQACQVYRGAALRPSAASAIPEPSNYEFPNTDFAVGQTAGQIRRWPDGRIVSTMFSSSSGGWTSGGAGFTPVLDAGDAVASNARHNWTISVPVATIEGRWPSIGTLQSIVVNNRNGLGDFGGRITAELGKVVVIAGDQGSVALTGDEVRQALGLYSNWFAVRTGCAGRDEPTVVSQGSTTAPVGFSPISPERIIDTRIGLGTTAATVLRGCTLAVSFPNKPAGAAAAAINIATTNSEAQGYITAYPCGTPRPVTAVVQTQVGNDIPGTTVVSLGPDGRVCLYASVPTDIVVDAMGWFTPSGGSKYAPETPDRLLDTRLVGGRPLAGTVTRIQVTGGNRPASAKAASVNIAATEALTGGFVTAYPCADRDFTSVVNIRPGLDISNHAFVPLDAAGGFCLWSSTDVHLVVDLDGVFGPFAVQSFRFWRPERAVDTRESFGSPQGRFRQFESRPIDLGPASGSVAFELTVVDPALPGHVTVWKPASPADGCDGPFPATAVVNAPANTNVAALVVVPTDTEGRICVNTHMPTDLVIDVSGRSS